MEMQNQAKGKYIGYKETRQEFMVTANKNA